MPCYLVSKRSAGDRIQTNLTADMITKNPWLPLPKEGRSFRYPLRMILKATKMANTHETINVSDKEWEKSFVTSWATGRIIPCWA